MTNRSPLLRGPGKVPNRRWNPLWRFRRVLFLLGLLGLVAVVGGIAYLAQEPLPADDFAALAQTTYVCTAEVTADCGPQNATAQLSAGEDREIIAYADIPQVMIDATVATEDKDFFNHVGIDPLGIARALYRDVRSDGATQGGSTITQQYVKNTFLTSDRTFERKLREATLAVKLEQQLTKEEILERYLNRIYLGRGAYGVQAASEAYFGKPATQLDLADAAFLAGLIRSPGTADPAKDPVEATRRRSTTLVRMVDEGYISQAQADEANQRDWSGVRPPQDRTGLGEIRGAVFGTEYFVEAVRQELAVLYPDGVWYTSGLRVYTTLNPDLQQAAYTTVVNELPADTDPSASIVALDSKGQVVAMMGGKDFDVSQVNLALGANGGGSGRQPGSSFKPIVLADAIGQGISAKSLYAAPSSITLAGANDGADWTVSGGGSASGYRDLVDGLRVSSNVVYAQLMIDVGPASVVDLARSLGVTADLSAVNSLVLGGEEVSVLDMAAAYSTLSNQGVRYAPVMIERIENSSGDVVCWYPVNGQCTEGPGRTPTDPNAIDPAVARQVNFALQEVVESGTGTAAQFGRPAAGKTGTTQDARDAWFVGFTCDLTAAVWMGYSGAPGQPAQTMSDFRGGEVHGGDYPAEMWSTFMTLATAGAPPCDGLAVSGDFSGEIRNSELSTTTTLPFCLDSTPAEAGGESTTTVADEQAATTAPCEPAPTTTIDPGATTTTDPDAPSSTTAPGDATSTPTTSTSPPPESTDTSESG
ncbi:MAG: transglycosylase domain-containing protein [Acidimicrobiales bacterium]